MERFTTQENMDMLFGILNSSNPELNHQNSDILQIFNNTLNSVIKMHTNSSLIEMNKIFLKTITIEFNNKQNEKPKTVYRNKEEEQKSRQNEFNKKFEQQQRNFGSFNKKRPEEIDFSDDSKFTTDINIDKTLEQRALDLKKITQNYNKKSEIHKKSWLNKDVVNLKISDKIIPIKPILLDKKTKEEKKVRFKIEEKTKLTNFLSKISKNRITKESYKYSFDTEERIKKLERDVSEIRNLIKEVLENSKKN